MSAGTINLLKSDEKSLELRIVGNELFLQGKFLQALSTYNKSLCFAETSETMALVYANRSALFYQLKLYPQCLNNNRLARFLEKRDEKNAMLKLGETRCYEQIHQMQSQQKSDPFDYFKLSYEPNEKIPFVIDGVEVQTVEQYGKKIIATRPLKVGDIISIESAFCPILLTNPELYPSEASNKFNHCRHCLNDNFLDLIPCADCNSAMFCNVNCMMQAHGYHQHDCSIASAFESLREDQVIIRSFFRAVSIVDGSIEELEELFNECLALPNRTIFDFDFSNSNDPEYGKNQLRVALSLSH